MNITLKNLVKIQKKTDKLIDKLEELNGKLHQENGEEFGDYYDVSGVDTDQLEKEDDPERKVQIELNGWFQSKNEKMKGDLKMNGIYRTLITNISPTQIFPVIMDIPETVWNEMKMSTKEEVYERF